MNSLMSHFTTRHDSGHIHRWNGVLSSGDQTTKQQIPEKNLRKRYDTMTDAFLTGDNDVMMFVTDSPLHRTK